MAVRTARAAVRAHRRILLSGCAIGAVCLTGAPGVAHDLAATMASYTSATVEYEEGPFKGERYQPNVNPRSLAKLATTYRVAGALEGLTVGGALRYQCTTYAEGTDWASADLPFRMEQAATRSST